MTVPQHCGACKYFIPGHRISTEAHDGACHASPPGNYSTTAWQADKEPDEDTETVVLALRDGTYTGWPLVQATDWCGWYEPRRKPRATKAER